MSSWIEKIKNDIVITTGDKQPHFPSWINAKKLVEYHVAEFNFPNVAGTLVKRGEAMGRKFDLEIFFQGDNHLDDAEAFETSSKNKRAWKITHPFYGTLLVQPTSFLYDNSALNITKITGTVLETISENPITTVDSVNQISISKQLLDAAFINVLITITPADVTTLKLNNTRHFKLSVPIITIPTEFEEFNHLFNVANAAVNNAIASPLLAIRYTIALITTPALFATTITQRLNVLGSTLQTLRNNISGLTSVSSKQVYQATAGSAISAMALATTTITQERRTGAQVLEVMDFIITNYNAYLADLDIMQTANGGSPFSFIPDSDSLIALNNLINYTVANLYNIALNSKQKRTIITEKDTNIVLLTHRLYGMDQADQNITDLIEENNLSMDELLEIKKGREIVYYI